MRFRMTSLFLASILLLTTVSVACAAQEYVGGYFEEINDVATERVLMGIDIHNIDLSEIPSGRFIGSVLSVAGGNPSRSGYVYQNGIAILRDGNCYWAPQIWNWDGGVDYYDKEIGTINYELYFVEMWGIGDGVANFRAFAYQYEDDVVGNTPYIYNYSFQVDTGDTKFRVGNDTSYGHRLNYFQFGVEASTHIEGWDMTNFSNVYYDSSNCKWRYLPGYSLQGSDAQITERSGWILTVGGIDYQGADIDEKYQDGVRWQYAGTTAGTDELLWSGSGIRVPRPYA